MKITVSHNIVETKLIYKIIHSDSFKISRSIIICNNFNGLFNRKIRYLYMFNHEH
jgi:hypothetical protein